MSRLALVTTSLAAVLALGLPPLADAEPQRGKARSRGGATVGGPARSARPPQAQGPSRRAPRRSPGVSQRGIRSAPTSSHGGQRQVGRVKGRSGGSATANRGRTTVGRGTVSRTPNRGRVTNVTPAGAGTSTVRRGEPQRQTGQVRARGAGRPTSSGAVTTVGSKPSRSRIINVTPSGSAAAPAAEAQRRGAVRRGGPTVQRSNPVGDGGRRGGVNRGSSVVNRRPPGDSSIVGRAVPRGTGPLVSSPRYGRDGRRHGGIHTRRDYGGYSGRYGYGYGYGGRHGYGHRYYGSGGHGGYYRHVYRPAFYHPAVYGSYFYFPGYSFGLGLGYGNHYGYGHYGHGYSGYAYYPYGHVSYVGHGSYADPYTGFLRLKVKPRDAQVYVNGSYVGIVDDFDGIFQKLRLEEGSHQVEIRHPGYHLLQLEVLIVVGEKVTFEGRLEPI